MSHPTFVGLRPPRRLILPALTLTAVSAMAANPEAAPQGVSKEDWMCVATEDRWQCDQQDPARAPVTQTADPVPETSTPPKPPPPENQPASGWGRTDAIGRPWPRTDYSRDLGPLGTDMSAADFGLRTLREPIKWGQCSTAFMAPLHLPSASEYGKGQHLEANSFQAFQDLPGDPMVLTGNAISLQPELAFRSERMIQRTEPSRLDAIGNTRLFDNQVALISNRGLYYNDTHQGSFEDVRYYLRDGHGRGTADHLELTGPMHQALTDAMFTTCASDSPFWSLEADHLRLDTEKGVGYADDAVLHLMDWPVFYTPYASFPIDERRKTGFLMPTLTNSETNGVGLNIPFYLNLAPNLDATLRARVMSERATMGEVKIGYLSEDISFGSLEATYLPNDNKRSDPDIDPDRHRIRWRHNQSLGGGFGLQWDYEDVSDVHYKGDFGQSLETTTTNHLERSLALTYNAKNWSLGARMRNYQIVNKTLADTSRPYDVYPQVTFNGSWMEDAAPLTVDLDAEFQHFVRDGRVSGSRVTVHPDIAYPLLRSWGYLTPRMELYASYYDLYDAADRYDASPAVSVPVLSLSGGLYFDRNYQLGDSRYIHTVEPLFQYVWAPYQDQSRIPIFDTGQHRTTFNNLLLTNRFSGSDRVNDANRLTLGMRNNLTRNGRTLAQLGIAEQIHFDDRKTVLSGVTPETADASELATFANLFPYDKVELRGVWIWDWNENANLEEVYELRHYPDRDQLLSLAYRYRRASVMQMEGTTRWRVTPGLHFVGQLDYNVRADELSDSLIGFEYESCCWLTRLVFHDFKNGGPDESDFTVGLQFELKGFGYAGADVEQELIERIPYYLRKE